MDYMEVLVWVTVSCGVVQRGTGKEGVPCILAVKYWSVYIKG